MTKASKVTISFMIFGFVFLYLPIVSLIMNSFSESEVPGVWTRFSLKWFKAALNDSDLIHAGVTSLKIATLSATGAVIMGVLAAVTTVNTNSAYCRRFLGNLIMIPAIMPEIVVGFSLLMFFMALESIFGIPYERGIITVVIGHIVTTMAYVHMTIRARLISFDTSIEEVATNLGARPFTIFIKIKMPIIGRSIIASWVLAFTLSIDDLVVASFLTGPGSTTLPILIFSNVRIGVTPVINAFSTMFICLIVLCGILSFVVVSSVSKRER
jgi:putrescine transport system permease protein